MSAPPKTLLIADHDEAARVRKAVREAEVSTLAPGCVLADARHIDDLVSMLADPAVSTPIYDLPRPINTETVAAWVADAEQGRARGETILAVTPDEHGRIFTYSRFTIWPDHASAEIAGAYRRDMQNAGAGKSGAVRSFDWMFRALGVRLICVTAALDNGRSARVIEAAGFAPMGERESMRPDGSIRRSRYWEMSRDAWMARSG
jgi:RimJ/RimL family protein N-acetyltransferase